MVGIGSIQSHVFIGDEGVGDIVGLDGVRNSDVQELMEEFELLLDKLVKPVINILQILFIVFGIMYCTA